MTGELINLRRARKARARDAEAREAAANRVRFGQVKAVRDAVRLETERAARLLDGNRIDDDHGGKG